MSFGLSRRYLWLLPAALLLLLAAFLAALPSLVASTAHRATIEALASSLTGRTVHIGGNLSLALFPEPQLIAERITIGGPDNETITADSLTLDIAMTALLRGRLSARSLTLQSPVIAFPWPMPGGAAAIAPPPWLASLHAQIANGAISLGAVRFTQVDADIFTGADGAASVAGTGNLQGQPVNVSLSLAGLDATGAAPISIDAAAGPATIHLSGTFNAASALAGTISFNTAAVQSLGPLGQPANGTAAISADPQQIALSRLQVFQGDARLNGAAAITLQNPIISLNLTGGNLILPTLDTLSGWTAPPIPIYLTLDANNSSLAGAAIPHLATRVELSAAGADVSALNATLPGNTELSLSVTADPAGHVDGRAELNSADFPALLAGFGAAVAAPDAWRQASLTSRLAGTLDSLNFQNISGTFGPGAVTGTVLLDRTATPIRLAGALHFDTLDLTPFAGAALHAPGAALAADFEITADRALCHGVKMSRLLIDASFDDQLIIRRFSAAIDKGFLAGSLTIGADGDISAARALLSLPTATPVAALIPAPWQPPPALLADPLAAGLIAAGPAGALQTSAILTLGDFTLTAAPTLDLLHDTATGALTLRHPSAIAAMKRLGLNASLAWPGAGSIALRADLTASPTQLGLPDFVLSFGDLTATGKISLSNLNQLDADIQADTLALPPVQADLTPFWSILSGTSGKITLSANKTLLAGRQIFGPAAASLTLQPNSDDFDLTSASLAGGTLTADINATTAPATPPSLEASVSLINADAAKLALPLAFPLTLPAGTIAAQAKLTAAGYGPKAWIATLAGPASLAAKSGAATGFNLPALVTALTAGPTDAAIKTAATTGATPFNTLSIAGALDHGIYAISNASLQSPSGTATATGNIDLPDQFTALNLTLLPNIPTPPPIGLAINGPWPTPQINAATQAALAWTPGLANSGAK
jgi:uncharacterized protein involved in outer membrane biogenesis